MLGDPTQRNSIPQPPFTKAGLAAVLTFAGLWLIVNPLHREGYVSKNWGTVLLLAAAAIAAVVVQWWCKPKGPVT